MKWAYGLTTVPARLVDLLPTTLDSLSKAGFDKPRLFIDGAENRDNRWDKFGLPLTMRTPTIRTFGNWILGLAEIYLREPQADRYAMFQDDFVTMPNLRQYLESIKMPGKCYWNLYTFPENQPHGYLSNNPKRDRCKKCKARNAIGLHHHNGKYGFYESNQKGRGAVALIFSREGVQQLLIHQHMVERVLSAGIGWRYIDGGIVSAMLKADFKECVHLPSLVQHMGQKSSMGNAPHAKALTFLGEDYDAMKLLR